MNNFNFPINIIFDSRKIIPMFNQVLYFSPIFINQISLFFKKAYDRIQKGFPTLLIGKGAFVIPSGLSVRLCSYWGVLP